jgi:hypothetical protein
MRTQGGPKNRKISLGRGQLVPVLAKRISAQQRFLAAIHKETPDVIADLREDVFPFYQERQSFSTDLIRNWACRWNLIDLDNLPLDFVRSAAEHTLYAWALASPSRSAWPVAIEGRPKLTLRANNPISWAEVNGLPAFETWLVDNESDAQDLLAPNGELPDGRHYDFLVVLANGALSYRDETGYHVIENTSTLPDIFFPVRFEAHLYDPRNESNSEAYQRIKKALKGELKKQLVMIEEHVRDCLGTSPVVKREDWDHFRWLAYRIVRDCPMPELVARYSTTKAAIDQALPPLRRLIGIPPPKRGRRSGTTEKSKRRRAESE